LAKSTHFSALQYTVFSTLLLFPSSLSIITSVCCFPTSSAYYVFKNFTIPT
jgi:hypothetical protein